MISLVSENVLMLGNFFQSSNVALDGEIYEFSDDNRKHSTSELRKTQNFLLKIMLQQEDVDQKDIMMISLFVKNIPIKLYTKSNKIAQYITISFISIEIVF